MEKYFLAVDIGASSGRHILSHVEDGKIVLEEVFRFENGMTEIDGHKCWDSELLFSHIKEGMKKCAELGKIPCYMGIDTWGVDYVLVDREGKRIGNAVGYRDDRTTGIDREVYQIIPEKELYARTGIAKQVFNTIYQLMALKKENPEQLLAAETLLLSPDYYNFLLTGKRASEYTIASTGQLVSPETKDWDYELIRMLGLPEKIFTPLQKPGTILGGLSDAVKAEIGYDCQVVMVTSHDTASAVLAVPSKTADFAYISSGTWSLLGVELENAICNEQSREANFTNEGGYDYKYRFLKNIMGLWMIQSVRNEMNKAYSFAQLCAMAEEVKDFPSRVDVDEHRFFAPDSMIEEIRNACRESCQPVPETPGELATVVYQSLADCYKKSLRNLEAMTGKTYPAVNIVGGGANADYLNQLTANATGKTVYAGPTEATAIGNIVCQMLACGDLPSVAEARACIFDSFAVKAFTPEA
ncbi:MAG: rhamnulokinase [Oscillospiraceae bacterium]|nr:rhamnulokinase [Oscillospiraceae bacterium]